MPKVLTTSIAAYNVQEYIRDTLESIVKGDCLNDLEVFIIDDGGQDETLSIAKEYENKYPGTFYAIHKDNGGYGSTVNYTIAHANGKYIKLLDGDDWFDSEHLKTLVCHLQEIDDDVVVTDYYKGENADNMMLVHASDESDNTIKAISSYKPKRQIGMWALTIKTEILRKSGIKFPEHTLYTDEYFSTIPFICAENIRFYRIPVYCYRLGRDGQSVSRESRIKYIDDLLKVHKDLVVKYNENKDSKNHIYLLDRVGRYHLTSLKTICLLDDMKKVKKLFKEYDLEVRQISEEVYKESVKCGKFGTIVKMIRLFNYNPLWIIRLIPGGIPNWA